jgi:hypothetical protein
MGILIVWHFSYLWQYLYLGLAIQAERTRTLFFILGGILFLGCV